MKNTFIRSCEHWSEASRNEMDDFYALASVDYKYLAKALDWKKWSNYEDLFFDFPCATPGEMSDH